jgi:hypothetical protein
MQLAYDGVCNFVRPARRLTRRPLPTRKATTDILTTTPPNGSSPSFGGRAVVAGAVLLLVPSSIQVEEPLKWIIVMMIAI